MSKKRDKINEGLGRLMARRLPGQTFSSSEIAKECGCDDQAITYISNRAMGKCLLKLFEANYELLKDVFGEAKVEEIVIQCESGKFRERSNRGRPKTRAAKRTVADVVPMRSSELRRTG